MSVTVLQTEDSIRDLTLYQKERLLHEVVDIVEYLPHTIIPRMFEEIDDSERRGMIRALRWVLDDEDILQCQQ